MLCLLYEALLLSAVALVAMALLVLAFHLAGAGVPRAVAQAYLLVVAACYFVPQWRAGRTLPMKTWRIALVSAAGSPLTSRQALVRYVAALVIWLLPGAAYLWALFDRDGQFLHDRLAGTRLVLLPRRLSASPERG